ncbi:MAG: hypothetical protein RIR47_117 [Bacteroidota bacterium]|jgi:hypothetical protein
MKLSNQAIGALMLALQKSLMEQSDIVPVLRGFILEQSDEGIVVANPPVLHLDNTKEEIDYHPV